MARLGLKLWSINKHYVEEAASLYAKGYFDFIELYAVPNSFEEFGTLWKSLNIPYIIHAPHKGEGVINLARKELFEENKKVFREVQQYADLLKAPYIVVHPGVGGEEEETIRQLSFLYDSRMLIENMPYISLLPGVMCQGYGYDFLHQLMEKNQIGFCLDVAHAYCAAHALNIAPENLFKQLNESLKPTLYHFSNIEAAGVLDRHKHLNEGCVNFEHIIDSISSESIITIETEKKYKDSLEDFKADVKLLRKLLFKRDKAYKLIPAQLQDSYDILQLSNDAMVREHSFHPATISKEEHDKWYAHYLTDKGRVFFVIRAATSTNHFIGYVRFEPQEGTLFYVITLHLIEGFRGVGLGTSVIQDAVTSLFSLFARVSGVIAYVKEENISSQKVFDKAGFFCEGKEAVLGKQVFKYIKQKI